MVLTVSSDGILKNNLRLMVSCHNFRWVSNDRVLLLGLGGHRCLWGCGVLQPFGQTRLGPFLDFSINYHIARHIQFLIIYGDLPLSIFGGFGPKPRDLV